jgi:hypothetical protein
LPVTVRVDELSTDVSVERSAPTAPAPQSAVGPEELRALLERAARDAERTRTEGYRD